MSYDGGLLSEADLESLRVRPDQLPTFQRIVVAVDPGSPGIAVVVGITADGRYYVLRAFEHGIEERQEALGEAS